MYVTPLLLSMDTIIGRGVNICRPPVVDVFVFLTSLFSFSRVVDLSLLNEVRKLMIIVMDGL
jgi:hypothetical protein